MVAASSSWLSRSWVTGGLGSAVEEFWRGRRGTAETPVAARPRRRKVPYIIVGVEGD